MPQDALDAALDELAVDRGPSPTRSPIDEALDRMETGASLRMRRSFRESADQDPEQAAEARRLSLKFGVPPAQVSRDLEGWRRRESLDQPVDAMRRETPATAEALEDPAFAAVSKGDLDKLGFLEWLVTAPQRSYAQSVAEMRRADLLTSSLFRPLSQEERDQLNSESFYATLGGDLGVGDSWFKGAVTGGAQLLANITFGATRAGKTAAIGAGAGAVVGGVAGFAATGGPGVIPGAIRGGQFGARAGAAIGGAEFGFRLEAGLAYGEFQEFETETGERIDDDAARAAALAAGALNAGLEVVGLGILADSIPGVEKLKGVVARDAIKTALRNPTIRAALADAAKTYGKTLTGETAVEVAQRAMTILTGELAKAATGDIPLRTPEDVFTDLLHEGMAAAQGFALVALPGPSIQVARDARRARDAQASVRWVQALGEGVAQSETARRDPAAVEKMLGSATEGGPIPTLYAPTSDWRTYWQEQGLDPSEVADRVTGRKDALQRAEREGIDLAIPTAKYAVQVAGSSHNAAVAEFLRLGADEMNAREAAAFIEQQQKAQEQAELDAAAGSREQVRERLTSQLVEGGKFEASTAGSIADLLSAGIGRMAEQAGEDPLQVFERYGLKVQRPLGVEAGAETLDAAGATAPEAGAQPVQAESGAAPTTEGEAGAEIGAPGGAQGLAGLEDVEGLVDLVQGLGGAEIVDRPETGTVENASGESAASAEALSRGEGMASRGEKFVVFNRAGAMRELLPADGVDYSPKAGETYGVLGPSGFSLREDRGGRVPANITTEATRGPATRPILSDRAREHAEAFEIGTAEGEGDLGSSERRRLPAPWELGPLEAFERAEPEADAQRLTPEIERELARIADELGEFPFVERTWNYVDDKLGNAAGGDAEIVAGAAGAPVYDDVLSWAPLNKGKGGRAVAKKVHGTRGAVELAIRKMIAERRIHNNIAEGAVRVAERRLDGDYRYISRPMLPADWGVEVPEGFVDALSEAVDAEVEAGALEQDALEPEEGGDVSFNVSEFGQDLFDLLEPMQVPEPTPRSTLSDIPAGGEFPAAGAQVDGREVLEDVPNRGSIEASLTDWTELEGVREVPFDVFVPEGKAPKFYSVAEEKRTRALAREIAESGQIKPLIIVVQPGDVYILEGGHRFDALRLLGAKSFPAVVVLDNEAQAAEDVLETGEVQPRLPGDVGAVREEDRAQPTEEVPFALTSEVSKAKKGKQTTLFQDAIERLTPEGLQAWADSVRDAEGLAVFDVRLQADGNIQLETLAARKGQTSQGAGSRAVEALADIADRHGKRIILALAEKGYQPAEGAAKTSSTDRLRAFYKRHGFVENKGRNKDYQLSTSVSMYRRPSRTFDQSAFHGSPHVFDRFSVQAIGTGEGNVVYGWGLYFASRREVADYYRRALSERQGNEPTMLVGGEPIPFVEPGGEIEAEDYLGKNIRQASYALSRGGIFSVENLIETIRYSLDNQVASATRTLNDIAEEREGGSVLGAQQQLDFVKLQRTIFEGYVAKGIDFTMPGRTFKVELPSEEAFLDWDAPASQQTPEIQAALKSIGVEWTPFTPPTPDEAFRAFGSAMVEHNFRAAGDPDFAELLNAGKQLALVARNSPSPGNTARWEQWARRNWQAIFRDRNYNDLSGEDLYNRLASSLETYEPGVSWNESKRLASQKLLAAGIPGIKYWDGASRSSGEGSRNYVIFDDKLVDVVEFDQPFFHGSPHTFQRFSTSAVGTGEGAAAYGWGLYFAENPEVAAGYFDRLAGGVDIRRMRLGSLSVSEASGWDYSKRAGESTLENIRASLAEGLLIDQLNVIAAGEGGFQKVVLQWLDDRISEYATEWPEGEVEAKKLRAQLARPGAVSVKFNQRQGGVYQVEIADEDLDTFLKWDAPINEQPKALQAAAVDALRRMGYLGAKDKGGPIQLKRAFDAYALQYERMSAPRTGETLYHLFVNAEQRNVFNPERGNVTPGEGQAPKLASLRLLGLGVKGIVYLDQFSRSGEAAKKTRNVVVFDDSIIKLTHKDGTPVTAEERAEFLQVGNRRRRGSISIGPDRQVTISLFETADLSTFLHETGHFFLEVMGDLVDGLAGEGLSPQQQQLQADYRAILEWLGVKDRSEITTEHHEKFARGFEAYLGEGRAPDIALRQAFARFRAWLIGVYRSLKNLNVRLTPEVREVMDRMLASEAAIRAAEQEGRLDPLFTVPEDSGMSPEQFELYRGAVQEASRAAREELDRKLQDEVGREQRAQWKARRAEVRSEVEKQAHDAPVYKALAAIRRGTTPAGEPLFTLTEPGAAATPMKLSKARLVEMFGERRVRALPKPYLYVAEGGLEPDSVAESFGFGSADELLQAIESAEPMTAAIERETDRRMLAEHGSMLLDGTLAEKAQAAAANEHREAVIRAELRALAQLRRVAAPFERAGQEAVRAEQAERAYERRWLEAEARLRIAIAEGRKQVEIDELKAEVRNLRQKARGGPAAIRGAVPPASVIRQLAKDRVASTRIRDLQPGAFWSTSRRAAQKAIEAAAKQDFDEAIRQKTAELLALATYREMQKAAERVETKVRWIRSLAKDSTRSQLGLAGDAYLDQVDGVLDRYEFAAVPKRILERRASVRKFVEGLESEGLPVDLPEEILEDARRINYREITLDEFDGVAEGLEQLVHLARFKNRLLKQKEKRELNALAADLAASIEQNAGRKVRKVERDRRLGEERRRLVSSFFASHRKLASLLREMDGFKDGGPMWDAIMRPLNEAGSAEAEANADASAKLRDIIDRAFPGRQKRRLYTKTFVPAVKQSLSKMEALMVAMNAGNEGNRQRVRDGEGWTDQQIDAVVATLSQAEVGFVQEMLDYLDSFWPDIAAKQERVYGVAPEKVEAKPIRTAFGEIRGGYFPLKYDERLSAQAAAGLDLEAANLAKIAAYAQATTKRGHTKARATRVKLPIRRDFGVIFEHVAQVVHDTTHHEALIDVGRILSQNDVREAIYKHYGDEVYRQVKDTVRDVAFGDIPATNGFEKALNYFRIGSSIAGLGWNFFTGALQPLGLTQSMVRIGPKWVARGISRWIRDAASMESSTTWIFERSAFMRSRARTMQREIADVRNSLGVSTGRLTGWVDEILSKTTLGVVDRQAVADSYFLMITKLQLVADIPTWLGAYEKAMSEGMAEDKAILVADQAVLDSQGGGQTKDLARVQRGGPLLKIWTQFMSYFSVTYNLAAESRRKVRHPVEVGRMAVDYMMLLAVPATLGALMRGAIAGDDEDEIYERIARENASYILGLMAGVRELSGIASGFTSYEGPTGTRAFAQVGKLAQQVQQGETDEAFWRALNDAGGVFFHYPATQVRRTAEGIMALSEGRTSNPLVLIFGPEREN